MKEDAYIADRPDWWKEAVFYQIYPRSFMDSNNDGIGDLKGIIARLDYLNDGTENSLGIDAIWLSPFFVGPEHDFGYDVADYCDVDPRFGSLKDFALLVAEAHRRNIKVILDLVVNHTSNEHPWFKESRSSLDNPKRNWYIWHQGTHSGKKPPNNWRNNFFGSAWSKDELTGQYYLHSFLKEQPDLNWANPAVEEAVLGVMRFWLERGADGFRLDVPHVYCKDKKLRNNPPFYHRQGAARKVKFSDRLFFSNLMTIFALPELQQKVYNQHQPGTHRVLKNFRRLLDSYPAKTSIGEIVADNPNVVASYYGEDNNELHMNFYFELLHCRFKAPAFKHLIDGWEKTLGPNRWPAYTLSNHDVKRALSRYNAHGQGYQRARLLMLMLLSLRGTPFIYYGEEIGMAEVSLTKHELKDPVGRKWYPFYPGRDGCRTPMQWNRELYSGFSKTRPWLPPGPGYKKYNAETEAQNPASLLNLTRRLIGIRKNLSALKRGRYVPLSENVPACCFAYLRETKEEKLLVALNFSNKQTRLALGGFSEKPVLLLSTDHRRTPGLSDALLVLGPWEGCLLKL